MNLGPLHSDPHRMIVKARGHRRWKISHTPSGKFPRHGSHHEPFKDAGGTNVHNHPPTVRSFPTPDAGGIRANSRWLRPQADTTGCHPHLQKCTPEGVPALPNHALYSHIASLSSGLCYEEPGTAHHRRLAAPPARIPRWRGARARFRAIGCWRSERPRSPSGRTQAHALFVRLHARIEESLFGLGIGDHAHFLLPMAGGLWGLHRERVRKNRCARLHCSPGGTSSQTHLSGGIHALVAKIRTRMRRTLSRLMGVEIHDATIRWYRSFRWCRLFRWWRFAQPPATGWHPCRGGEWEEGR